MNADKTRIKAILLDLEGTLYIGREWIPQALETVRWCIDQGYAVRFITNTSVKNRRQVARRFHEAGLELPESLFFTPARAARQWFAMHPLAHGILALVHPNLLEDLDGLPLTPNAPADYVLVGDMDDAWTIVQINHALRALLQGARLTALHRNRRWLAHDGYRLDAGAFVAAFEYGAETRCEVLFGKPARVFFEMALRDAGVQPGEAIMVGDDLETDGIGARECGIHTALVKTGKFRPEQIKDDTPALDMILEDVGQLPQKLLADPPTKVGG